MPAVAPVADPMVAPSAAHPLMQRRAYPVVRYPAENPDDDRKALLGKILFWDEQLSTDDTVACGTCHRGAAGGSDPRSATADARLPGLDGMLEPVPGPTSDDIRGALGIAACDAQGRRMNAALQVTQRKPPTNLDAMFTGDTFWDGRASRDFVDPDTGVTLIRGVLDAQSGRIIGGALESQAVLPPISTVEMACADPSWSKIHRKLAVVTPLALARDVPSEMASFIEQHGRSYPAMFEATYGATMKVSTTDPDNVINTGRIAFALATYQRRLTSSQTPWDRWNAGDPTALSARQVRGFEVFMGKGRCQACHAPPLFMDLSFHYIGFHDLARDAGKGNLVGSQAVDRGRMKTPTLRNVGLREPGGLLHQGDGPGHDLSTVLGLYNDGGLVTERAGTSRIDPALIDPLITHLELTADEIDMLLDFLRNGLTDPRVQGELPPFDRPTLSSEAS